jgi:hypothetical protein
MDLWVSCSVLRDKLGVTLHTFTLNPFLLLCINIKLFRFDPNRFAWNRVSRLIVLSNGRCWGSEL